MYITSTCQLLNSHKFAWMKNSQIDYVCTHRIARSQPADKQRWHLPGSNRRHRQCPRPPRCTPPHDLRKVCFHWPIWYCHSHTLQHRERHSYDLQIILMATTLIVEESGRLSIAIRQDMRTIRTKWKKFRTSSSCSDVLQSIGYL